MSVILCSCFGDKATDMHPRGLAGYLHSPSRQAQRHSVQTVCWSPLETEHLSRPRTLASGCAETYCPWVPTTLKMNCINTKTPLQTRSISIFGLFLLSGKDNQIALFLRISLTFAALDWTIVHEDTLVLSKFRASFLCWQPKTFTVVICKTHVWLDQQAKVMCKNHHLVSVF